MSPRTIAVLLSLTLALGAGCGSDTAGVPQPQPVPGPIGDLVRRSSPALTEAQTLLVGLPGAVLGPGKLLLTKISDGTVTEGQASSSGSFSVVASGDRGEQLELRFHSGEGTSEPLILPGVLSQGDLLLGGVRSNGPVVSAPDASGMVTVTNDDDPPPVEAAADADLLVANARTGDVVVSRTDANGRFRVEIAAVAGDEIQLMLVDASFVDRTSDFLSFDVPL